VLSGVDAALSKWGNCHILTLGAVVSSILVMDFDQIRVDLIERNTRKIMILQRAAEFQQHLWHFGIDLLDK
jgi:hypothetical protein